MVNGLDAALLTGGELNSLDMSGAGTSIAFLTGGGRRMRPLPGILPLLWCMIARASAGILAAEAVAAWKASEA